MNTRYETDIIAWANEQAMLIRAGRFDQLDLTHQPHGRTACPYSQMEISATKTLHELDADY